MAKTATASRRTSRSDSPVDYDGMDPNHPSILAQKIFKINRSGYRDRPPMTRQGAMIVWGKIAPGKRPKLIRTDGHAITDETFTTRIPRGTKPFRGDTGPATTRKKKPSAKRKAPRARKSKVQSKRPNAAEERPPATLNFCPCCGMSLEAFNAAAELTR